MTIFWSGTRENKDLSHPSLHSMDVVGFMDFLPQISRFILVKKWKSTTFLIGLWQLVFFRQMECPIVFSFSRQTVKNCLVFLLNFGNPLIEPCGTLFFLFISKDTSC